MIKLGVAVSKSSVALAKAGRLDADYIQYYGQLGVQPMKEILPYKPVMLHDFPEPFLAQLREPISRRDNESISRATG